MANWSAAEVRRKHLAQRRFRDTGAGVITVQPAAAISCSRGVRPPPGAAAGVHKHSPEVAKSMSVHHHALRE